jgi:hypothetical protein
MIESTEESSISQLLGLRIAARFFFNTNAWGIKRKPIVLDNLKLFQFDKVLEVIRNTLASLDQNQDLLLVIHFDEIQKIQNDLLKSLISECADYILQVSASKERICLLPVISGTSVSLALHAIDFSRL